MTSVLPLGGADLSGYVIVIAVGGDLYFSSSACAFATTSEPPLLGLEEPPELEEPLFALSSPPQAANASASTNAAMIAVRPRAPRRPRCRRSGSVWGVMLLSLCVRVGVTMGGRARPSSGRIS